MLKSLEIYGFKSFADRTRFEFSPGLTGVVGPNGSGKSNVVDALKWILGDQSPKSLRGQEMTDVIFNGSASRKPCTFAEAFLTIDNSQKFLKVDATEVTIGRRLYRGGDAEYLINKAPARLKDIRDLLLGTGAGNAAYCIIEQGRVDQILQANPTNRRIVFEEAAGISRFKARRVEAQRKLERVAQNLQRLKDIVDEVEAQLNATRGHAAKAVKYREISDELRRWWLGLAADDYRAVNTELDELAQRFAGVDHQLQALAAQQQELDACEAHFDRELSDIEQHLKEVERRFAQHREAIATQEASLQFQSSRLQEQDAEGSRLRDQQLLLDRRLREAEGEAAACNTRLRAASAEETELRGRLTAQDSQLQSAAAAVERDRLVLDSCRTNQWELTKSTSATEQAVAAWDAQHDALEQSRSRLVGRREDILQEQQRLDTARDGLKCDYETLRQALETAQAGQRECLQKYQALAAEQQLVQQRLASLRESRSAAIARRTVLEDLELRQEGLGIGVRELLHRARHSTESPWNTIVGSVADLMDVDLESAGLIEVALGPRAQFIVLREFQPLLDYLTKDAVLLTGRVGFLAVPDRAISQPLPPLKDRTRLVHLQLPSHDGPDLRHRAGVVRRADELIASERGIHGLAAAVLGDTWVVQDLAVGIELATEYGRGLRFVTLQGELLDGQGALHLGTARSETSLLTRKSELRRIKNDLARLERDVALQEAEHAELLDAVAAVEGTAAAAAQAVASVEQQLREALAVWQAADQDADRCRREAELLEGQLQSAEEELERVARQQRESESRWSELKAKLQAAEQDLVAAEQAWTASQQAAQSLEQQKSAEQLDLVKHAERLRAEQAALARWTAEFHERRMQLEDGTQRIEESAAKRQHIALQVLNARAALAEKYHAVDAIDREVQRWQQDKDRLRKRRGEHVERELHQRQERRKLQEARHADEIRSRELQHLLTSLEERIQDEYQLSLKEVAEQGHSAWALYLDESAESGRELKVESQVPETTSDLKSSMAVNRQSPEFAEIRPEIEAQVVRLRRKLKLLGHVNTDSLHDLEQLEQRFTQLSGQLQDLVEAQAALEDIIRRINHESRRLFAETFNTIRGNFRQLFRKVFGGGEGDIVLEDPEDVLECGIEITARPPGKELRSLSLLSGGEKTMTAIALIMAIFQAKPSPFCILDEVDAALDEANVDRFAAVLREFQTTTQFIMITHHKRSMMVADVLYGVTMEESGVSKRMSVRFEDIAENGEFRRAA
jgi:chromosome segregation protein